MMNTLDEVAERVPERLEANLADFNANSDLPYKLAMSIGMVKVDFDRGTSLIDIIKLADARMYDNKRKRKGQAG
jgi:GGDEF domain-containing protein